AISDASGTFRMSPGFGMDFDPVRRAYILWDGGGTVWKLSIPTPLTPTGWAVLRQPDPVGSVPPVDVGTGILGKFKYIENLDAFMALDVNGDVWLYKPVGWSNPDTNQ